MIKEQLQAHISQLLKQHFALDIPARDLLIVPTKKEFEGDFTLTVFPIAGKLKKAPPVMAQELGALLQENHTIDSFQVIQGFLNMTLKSSDWIHSLMAIYADNQFGNSPAKHQKVLVEFCSPNTNKPLHLGHIRNMLLGASTARILEKNGYDVNRIQVINDRGIAICKSMLSWQKWGAGKTPATTGIKGDHFVGDYYVLFEKEFKQEYNQWQSTDLALTEFNQRKNKEQDPTEFFKEYKNQYFNKYSALGKEARDMLLAWENGDEQTMALWKTMNQWVFEGFDATYRRMGVAFDHTDYESITYLLGKEAVARGLKKNILYKKEDQSVWIDLTEAGMDQKVVLRSDGTSVYITQDLGTAQMRYEKYKMDKLIYVVADEQDYHFKALFEIIKRYQEPYANGLYHLSYGMVELPEGKMKSREGTVVDADDLVAEIIADAELAAKERGELIDLEAYEQKQTIENIALGAIKFFMLKVHPKKRMVFNPKESLDLQGQTGPYVQNAYVRIQSILRKTDLLQFKSPPAYTAIKPEEKELIVLLETYPEAIQKSADQYDPSEIANYSYALAKAFHRFYHEVPILRSDDPAAKDFRLMLAGSVGKVLKNSFELLGISMPERM